MFSERFYDAVNELTNWEWIRTSFEGLIGSQGRNFVFALLEGVSWIMRWASEDCNRIVHAQLSKDARGIRVDWCIRSFTDRVDESGGREKMGKFFRRNTNLQFERRAKSESRWCGIVLKQNAAWVGGKIEFECIFVKVRSFFWKFWRLESFEVSRDRIVLGPCDDSKVFYEFLRFLRIAEFIEVIEF